MSQTNQALTEAIAAVERLPLKLQRELAERLFAKTARERAAVTVRLKQLPHEKQTRLSELLDKSNEGKLSRSEKTELKRLGSELDGVMFANSVALARAVRPELFDAKGRPQRARIHKAIETQSTRKAGNNPEKTQR
jgi:hypothetical protein